MNHQSNTQNLLKELEELKLMMKISENKKEEQLEIERIERRIKELEDAIQRDYWLA
jgi:hypothetical protein